MRDYMQAANEEVLSIITIEHIDAVRNIDQIVEAKGVDVAVIGPGDMATSLGHYGQIDHPEVQAAMQTAEKSILKSGIALGGVAYPAEQANRMAEIGYRLIILGIDCTLLQKGAAAVLQGVKRA